MNASGAERMTSYLRRIATGPEMSKDLALDEARDGMSLILNRKVEPIQAAIFLIALRMKRESDDENRGVLDAVRNATRAVTATVDDLADVADPYDGFTRHLPASPFLPALLAACGVPTVSHGCYQLGPKFGVTHRQILTAAGAPADLTPKEAAARISDSQIGWAYMDQRVYCPSLHDLAELRRLIVKRACLSTLEKLCGPVRAKGRTHLLIGYVHRGYERLLSLVARHAGYASALIVRGVEGGVIPSLNARADCTAFHEDEADRTLGINPQEAGIETVFRAVPLTDTGATGAEKNDDESGPVDTTAIAQAAATVGLAALAGQPGPTRDSLVYAAAIFLYHLQRFNSVEAAAAAARSALESGAAREHFQKR
jgi:anthranilate phosphoribosyltransferase